MVCQLMESLIAVSWRQWASLKETNNQTAGGIGASKAAGFLCTYLELLKHEGALKPSPSLEITCLALPCYTHFINTSLQRGAWPSLLR
jgi:hypothetical protein